MDLQKYIIDGEINIPKTDWLELKNNYDKMEIIENLNKIVDQNKISFKTREVTIEDSIKDYNILCNFNTKDILVNSEWISKFDYKYKLSRGYIAKTSKGKNASNFFMQEERHRVGSHNKSSLYDAWQDKKLRTQTFKALFTMKRSHINNSTILQTAECKHYLPSSFRPTAAKAIYDITKAEKILDMSAGWGDRLVASCGREYLGFDPNTKLKNIYEKIINTHKLNAKIESIPFEDCKLKDSYFDVMFSSPPYFQCEKYSDEATQSYNRYSTIDLWLNNFLLKSISIIINSLKTGGYLIINISDINIKGKRQFICDKMNDFIKSKNLYYIGCIGLQLSKLPNTQEKTNNIFGEPIWIWRKQ